MANGGAGGCWNEVNERIRHLRQLPLEPKEYCDRWVPHDPNRNYRQACINSLAKATGLSPNTIKDWGGDFSRRPHYVLYVLRQVDVLQQLVCLLGEQEDLSMWRDIARHLLAIHE